MVPERLCNGRVSVRLSRRSIACSSDVQLVCCWVRAQAAAGLVSIDSCRRPSCICGQSFREPRYDNAVQHSRVKLGTASKTSVGPAPRCRKLSKTVQDNLSECRPVLLTQLRHRIYPLGFGIQAVQLPKRRRKSAKDAKINKIYRLCPPYTHKKLNKISSGRKL